MTPYYIISPDKFNIETEEFSTIQQQTITHTINSQPITKFRKKECQMLRDFIKYELECEVLYKKKGRAYGTPDIFSQYILIEEESFYFCPVQKIIIMACRKEICKKFIQDVNKQKDANFSLSTIDVDFEIIIENQKSLGVHGVWLGKLPDIKLTALALMGSQVHTSHQYKELLSQGAEITNITIIFDYNGNQEKIMITKDGGVILYNRLDETDALQLISSVYSTFLKITV